MKKRFVNPLITRILFACVLGLAWQAAYAQPYTSDQSLQRLHAAIAQYQDIVSAGGWREVPSWSITQIEPTIAQQSAVIKRLTASNDWWPSEQNIPGNQQLENALRRFQFRHGLLANGMLNAQTIAAMNVPAYERLAQLKRGLEQAAVVVKQVRSNRYVLVNIPAQELVAVDNGRTELVSAVIVGHTSRATPTMQASITGVSFHPVWNVPPGIARKDFYPLLRKNPRYFERENIQILRWRDNQVLSARDVINQELGVEQIRFRRKPDNKNPLGRVRIDMPNAQAIFLHDTPSTALFGWPNRSFSSGCVRVSRIVELANWILRDASWSAEQTSRVLRARQSVQVSASSAIPVHLVYLTAWADDAGQANFRDDLYGLQESLQR